MPCCAAAVFLLGQICAAIAGLKAMLGFSQIDAATAGAAAWRPGAVMAEAGFAPRTESPIRFRLPKGRALLALAAVEFVLTVFGANLLVGHEGGILPHKHAERSAVDVRAMLADPKYWCGDAHRPPPR